MKQYTIGEALDIAIKDKLWQPKVVFSTDCEKAIAEARADGYKQGYNQMNASSDYIDDYEYAKRVMEDDR